MPRTKIVATIGPASAAPSVIASLIRAGMSAARLNFSHGTHADHAKLIRTVRGAAARAREHTAIIADLQGPKLRVGALPPEGLRLARGASVTIVRGHTAPRGMIPVVYSRFHSDITVGEHILFSDGAIEVVVRSKSGIRVHASVVVPGTLMSHKGFMVPGGNLRVSSLTAKDREDIRFINTKGIDYVALSFVRSARDVRALRRLLPTSHAPGIIAKIETRAAVDAIDEIISEADAIMVARGDLGLEARASDVPLFQKTIIRKCLAAGKPVIVATQMLGSMTAAPRPTRAEVSDVANAVIDHTDAVMLSDETAVGKYPLAAVRTMAEVAENTEQSSFDNVEVRAVASGRAGTAEAIGETAGLLARTAGIRAIVATTITGETARRLSQFRPELPLYVGTPDPLVARRVNLSWGVRPFLLSRIRGDREALTRRALQVLLRARALRRGMRVAVVSGDPGVPGGTNSVAVVQL